MSSSKVEPHRGGRGARLVAAIGGAAACILIPVAALSPAAASAASSTSSGNTGNTGSAGIVTPLLKLFEFGNTLGLPLACSDAGSVISIVGSQTGGAAASSKLVTELDTLCNQLSSEGGKYLQQAIAESRALALLNPLIDPLIADLAQGLSTIGTQYGSSLAPFGPTIAGLGGTVTFFEGS